MKMKMKGTITTQIFYPSRNYKFVKFILLSLFAVSSCFCFADDDMGSITNYQLTFDKKANQETEKKPKLEEAVKPGEKMEASAPCWDCYERETWTQEFREGVAKLIPASLRMGEDKTAEGGILNCLGGLTQAGIDVAAGAVILVGSGISYAVELIAPNRAALHEYRGKQAKYAFYYVSEGKLFEFLYDGTKKLVKHIGDSIKKKDAYALCEITGGLATIYVAPGVRTRWLQDKEELKDQARLGLISIEDLKKTLKDLIEKRDGDKKLLKNKEMEMRSFESDSSRQISRLTRREEADLKINELTEKIESLEGQIEELSLRVHTKGERIKRTEEEKGEALALERKRLEKSEQDLEIARRDLQTTRAEARREIVELEADIREQRANIRHINRTRERVGGSPPPGHEELVTGVNQTLAELREKLQKRKTNLETYVEGQEVHIKEISDRVRREQYEMRQRADRDREEVNALKEKRGEDETELQGRERDLKTTKRDLEATEAEFQEVTDELKRFQEDGVTVEQVELARTQKRAEIEEISDRIKTTESEMQGVKDAITVANSETAKQRARRVWVQTKLTPGYILSELKDLAKGLVARESEDIILKPVTTVVSKAGKRVAASYAAGRSIHEPEETTLQEYLDSLLEEASP